jgi:hypothetical protein
MYNVEKEIEKLNQENSSSLKIGIITGVLSISEFIMVFTHDGNTMETLGASGVALGLVIISGTCFLLMSINNKLKSVYNKFK